MAELVTRPDPDLHPDVIRPPFLVGWAALWMAITLNVTQVFLLDNTEGLRQLALLPIAAVGFLAELWLFGRAVRCLSPVIAYAAYGTTPAVVTLLSVTFFGEALTLPKLAGVGAVTAGVILLATEGTPAPRATCAENIAPSPATTGASVNSPPAEPNQTGERPQIAIEHGASRTDQPQPDHHYRNR